MLITTLTKRLRVIFPTTSHHMTFTWSARTLVNHTTAPHIPYTTAAATAAPDHHHRSTHLHRASCEPPNSTTEMYSSRHWKWTHTLSSPSTTCTWLTPALRCQTSKGAPMRNSKKPSTTSADTNLSLSRKSWCLKYARKMNHRLQQHTITTTTIIIIRSQSQMKKRTETTSDHIRRSNLNQNLNKPHPLAKVVHTVEQRQDKPLS